MFKNDTLRLVEESKKGFAARVERNRERLLDYYNKPHDHTTDIYGDAAFFALYNGVHVEEALEQIARSAQWFELPHPHGRNPKGESTFCALALMSNLNRAADKLSDEVRKLIDTFFLHRNFESMYESENHRLLHHTAVYLAAQFYQGKYFEHMGKTAEEIVKNEEEYLLNYIDFRACRSWGEFDSYGYLGVDFNCLLDIHDFSRNEKLRKMARMMLDIILIDMAVDSRNGLWGGAHGRIYPPSALNAQSGGMQNIYGFYFDTEYAEQVGPASYRCVLSSYHPSDVVYQLMLCKQGNYISRKGKHLHCIPEEQQPGTISKYTCLAEKYIIGAVNRQDHYIPDTPQRWYAHHEQHELDAMILTHPRAKVFTHHPGPEGSKEHNQWTGDLGCCCVQTFCDMNVAMAIYDIPQQAEKHYINAYMCEGVMDEVRLDNEWAFCMKDNVYIALYGNGGWHYTDWFFEDPRFKYNYRGEKCRVELVSEGLKHGCIIEISDQEPDFETFIARIKQNKVDFNPEDMSLCYTSCERTLYMKEQERKVNSENVRFPYETFDSPYAWAKAGENKIYVTGFNQRLIYDFEQAKIINADAEVKD